MSLRTIVLSACTILFLILLVIPGIQQCSYERNPIKEIVYIPTPDTMSVKEVILLKEQLRRTQDSLNLLKTDTTMSAELFVAKYKLERIRYYNDIAKKGNNIKYLRGWINRVLER